MKVEILKPISYCFGVTKAIDTAFEIRNKYKDKNVYFFGDLVHNKNVINYFAEQGIKVVAFDEENAFEQLEKFTSQDIVIFSAHGHDKKYEDALKKNNVTFFDTTCVKVNQVLELIKNSDKEIIYIGKRKHPETFASLSYSQNIYLYEYGKEFDFSILKTDDPLVLNQSTLSFLELAQTFEKIRKTLPKATIYDEICGAARVRQENILNLHDKYDLIVVIGDSNSSNSTKLYEISKKYNTKSETIMVADLKDIKKIDLKKYKSAVLTSGTSTPLAIINEILDYLKEL